MPKVPQLEGSGSKVWVQMAWPDTETQALAQSALWLLQGSLLWTLDP